MKILKITMTTNALTAIANLHITAFRRVASDEEKNILTPEQLAQCGEFVNN